MVGKFLDVITRFFFFWEKENEKQNKKAGSVVMTAGCGRGARSERRVRRLQWTSVAGLRFLKACIKVNKMSEQHAWSI